MSTVYIDFLLLENYVFFYQSIFYCEIYTNAYNFKTFGRNKSMRIFWNC